MDQKMAFMPQIGSKVQTQSLLKSTILRKLLSAGYRTSNVENENKAGRFTTSDLKLTTKLWSSKQHGICKRLVIQIN